MCNVATSHFVSVGTCPLCSIKKNNYARIFLDGCRVGAIISNSNLPNQFIFCTGAKGFDGQKGTVIQRLLNRYCLRCFALHHASFVHLDHVVVNRIVVDANINVRAEGGRTTPFLSKWYYSVHSLCRLHYQRSHEGDFW